MKFHHLPFLLLPLIAQAEGEKIPYTCDNGSRIDISFLTPADGRPQATLHFSDAVLVLPQVPAATGSSYKQDGIGLHTKDDEAIFEDGKGNLRHCQRGEKPPAGAQSTAAASSFIDITGSVSYPVVHKALPRDAVLTLRVQDTVRPGAAARTLAEQSIGLDGQQGPIAFQMLVDRDLLRKKARLTVSARIERAGKVLFVHDKVYPAQTDGQALPLEITLKPAGKKR